MSILTSFLILLLSIVLSLPFPHTLTCSTSADYLLESETYQCPGHCSTKYRTNLPDLRRLELNFRICTHPNLAANSPFTIVRNRHSASVEVIVSHKRRRKRELLLTPSWGEEPRSMSVNQGSEVEIGCSLQGMSDTVSYQWFFSESFPSNVGDVLSDRYNYNGDDSGAIVIESASSRDAGFYQCKVTDETKDGRHVVYSNIVEIKIETYYLRGPSADELEPEMRTSFQAEDLLVLDCPEVDSNPPALISWLKDDEPLTTQKAFIYPFDEEQTFDYNSESYTVLKNSLVLMSITASDNGIYKCRATNHKTGETADLKEYQVNNFSPTAGSLDDVKPQILKESPVSVEEGQSVELYCLGVGHPAEMKYTWQLGQETIVGDGEKIVITDFGRKMTISNAANTDVGLYSCTCSNERGSSQTFYNVNVDPPTTVPEITFTEYPDPLYFHDAYSDTPTQIFLPCSASGADQVRFWKDGRLLIASDRYTFDEDRGLTFNSYNSSDSGVYQCVASNAEHWVQTMTFVAITEKVTVNARADVTRRGTDATMTCTVSGYPYPEVTWSHNGSPITNILPEISPYIVDTPPTHSLVIKQIYFTDGGVYTCTATSRTQYTGVEYSHTVESSVTLTIGDLNSSEHSEATSGGVSVVVSVWCQSWTLIFLALILSML